MKKTLRETIELLLKAYNDDKLGATDSGGCSYVGLEVPSSWDDESNCHTTTGHACAIGYLIMTEHNWLGLLEPGVLVDDFSDSSLFAELLDNNDNGVDKIGDDLFDPEHWGMEPDQAVALQNWHDNLTNTHTGNISGDVTYGDVLEGLLDGTVTGLSKMMRTPMDSFNRWNHETPVPFNL